jgi:hypothetical protein
LSQFDESSRELNSESAIDISCITVRKYKTEVNFFIKLEIKNRDKSFLFKKKQISSGLCVHPIGYENTFVNVFLFLKRLIIV